MKVISESIFNKLQESAKPKNTRYMKEDVYEDDYVDDVEEEEDDWGNYISMLDIALSELPDGDTDNIFLINTKMLFEELEDYEEEIPEKYYENSKGNYRDWSDGINDYLSDIGAVEGKSDNTYNWNAPVTNNVNFTEWKGDGKVYYVTMIHKSGDVRGNYTTSFCLAFDNEYEFYEVIEDTAREISGGHVNVDERNYYITPLFFSEGCAVWCEETEVDSDFYGYDMEDFEKAVADGYYE